MSYAIEVAALEKDYEVRERRPGLSGALRALARPERRIEQALCGVGFRIDRGERVAFVGANGAGKSTTIKILTGILHPSRGEARVLDLVPWQQRRRLAYRIGTVFGQRTQLWYHLPPRDTFELLEHVYDQDPVAHRKRRERFIEMFEIGAFLDRPVRQLSLGQRMRCELVASLLHEPEVLFLDEPTIGLDVAAKAVIRDLIRAESREMGRTLLFTSHDTGDLEQVCERVIVLHEGQVLLDEAMSRLRTSYIGRKRITLHCVEPQPELPLAGLEGVEIQGRSPHRVLLEVDVARTPVEKLVEAVIRHVRLHDLSVEDPPMEEVVREIYARAPSRSRTGEAA